MCVCVWFTSQAYLLCAKCLLERSSCAAEADSAQVTPQTLKHMRTRASARARARAHTHTHTHTHCMMQSRSFTKFHMCVRVCTQIPIFGSCGMGGGVPPPPPFFPPFLGPWGVGGGGFFPPPPPVLNPVFGSYGMGGGGGVLVFPVSPLFPPGGGGRSQICWNHETHPFQGVFTTRFGVSRFPPFQGVFPACLASSRGRGCTHVREGGDAGTHIEFSPWISTKKISMHRCACASAHTQTHTHTYSHVYTHTCHRRK